MLPVSAREDGLVCDGRMLEGGCLSGGELQYAKGGEGPGQY